MPHLVLERAFDSPLSVAKVRELASNSGWCYALYRMDWHGSFLSADGHTMVCTFSAPDVESARAALRRSGADTKRLWTTSVHDAPASVTPNVIVERLFSAPDTFERVHALALARKWCFEQRRIRWARSLHSTDGRRMLCFYEAPDAESVRAAQREAELPVETTWAFARIGPDTTPPPD